jgi:peptide/nickel transport system substrate-binding protein
MARGGHQGIQMARRGDAATRRSDGNPPRHVFTPSPRQFLPFLFLLLMAFSLSCGQSKEEKVQTGKEQSLSEKAQPAYGDLLIQGSIGDASNLIPLLASDSASHDISGLIFNGLLKYDKNLNLVGDLAESWEVSPDGLTITFKLRNGVKWQDGKGFTAEDIMFGYQTIINPNTRTAYSGDYREVKQATVVDRYTFRVIYHRPFAPGLSSWGSLVVLPKHILEGQNINTTPFSRNPVGTGPYKFKEWKTGEKIVLVANPDYFDRRPYVDGFIYRIIPDPATMFLELKAGGLDFMGLSPCNINAKPTPIKCTGISTSINTWHSPIPIWDTT